MAVQFTASPAPRFPTINLFNTRTEEDRWTCIYMKLSGGEWSWASKCVVGTCSQVHTTWSTALMTPVDVGQGQEALLLAFLLQGGTQATAIPPREWSICKDDDVSRTWSLLIQRVTKEGVVYPAYKEFIGTIREMQKMFPRSIFWPKA